MGRGELDEREVRVLERCKSLGIHFGGHGHDDEGGPGHEHPPDDGEPVHETDKKNK